MNIEMPCVAHYVEDIPKALEDGRLEEADLNEAVGYILRTTLYYETRKDPQSYGPEAACMPGTYKSGKTCCRGIHGTSEK